MKRNFRIAVVLFVLVMLVATPVFASAASLGSDVYGILAKYGMTIDDKDAIDAYVKKYNVTDEQAAVVLDYTKLVADVFVQEGITHYRDLDLEGVNEIKSYAYAAADVVGATVKVEHDTKTFSVEVIGPDGVPAYKVIVDETTRQRLNGPYTGNVSTAVVTSVAVVAVIAVAAMVTLKLRKEA